MNAWIIILVILLLVLGILCLLWCCSHYFGPANEAYIQEIREAREKQEKEKEEARAKSQKEKEDRIKYEEEKAETLEKIREIQKKQMQEFSATTDILLRTKSGTGLIIGVDATPTAIGGYCIDVRNKSCEYYALTEEELPWRLRDTSRLGDSAEFEMKNFFFALLIWEERILRNTRVTVYTDNASICRRTKNEYGKRCRDFIEHIRCQGANVTYEVLHSKMANLEQFAKFIQPADDLSRGELQKGLEYLRIIYGLPEDSITGARVYKDTQRVTDDPNNIIARVSASVRRSLSRVPRPNDTTDYVVSETDSLRSIHKRVSVV